MILIWLFYPRPYKCELNFFHVLFFGLLTFVSEIKNSRIFISLFICYFRQRKKYEDFRENRFRNKSGDSVLFFFFLSQPISRSFIFSSVSPIILLISNAISLSTRTHMRTHIRPPIIVLLEYYFIVLWV